MMNQPEHVSNTFHSTDLRNWWIKCNEFIYHGNNNDENIDLKISKTKSLHIVFQRRFTTASEHFKMVLNTNNPLGKWSQNKLARLGQDGGTWHNIGLEKGTPIMKGSRHFSGS